MSQPSPPQPNAASILEIGGRGLLALARLHRQRQQLLARRARTFFRRLWAFVEASNAQASWARVSPQANAAMRAVLTEAARGADEYVTAALAHQGVTSDLAGTVSAAAFARSTADGRDIAGLLSYPAFEVSAFVDQGMADAQALSIGQRHLERIVQTEVADAARVATGVAVTADQKATGYIRMLTPPSCSRCVILAGQFYRWNDGFERHPQCFPAGTVVSGPATDGATRRWYQGELIVIRTAGGKNLTATANHPILTDQGWLPANLLDESSYVVGRAGGDRSGALVVPDHDQVPARIEDLWRADGMRSVGRVPVAAEDFHGDGFGSSHVDVVLADSLLWNRHEVSLLQELGEEPFTIGAEYAVTLAHSGTHAKVRVRPAAPTYRAVGGLHLCGSLGWRHLARADKARRAWSADLHPAIEQPLADDGTADPETVGQCVLALARQVSSHDVACVHGAISPRWDAPAAAFSVESRMAYSSRGDDLRLRLAGKVELERVVELRRIEWSGHVYNLTSREGWYDANGIIVSNCDCIHIPAAEDVAGDVRTDPKAYFDSLTEEEQNAAFTKAGAQAIRDGSDLGRVVNARRTKDSLYTADGLKYTTEATTRRGTGRKRRLVPESIYKIAGDDREEALRLLRVHGYIIR